MRVLFFFLLLLVFASCRDKKTFRILGNIEDPQNEIAVSIAKILNESFDDTVVVRPGIGSAANIDSVLEGKVDFAIVDNYSAYHSSITSVMPVYGQVFHVLHKKDNHPTSLHDLLVNKKVFAGSAGSGSWRLAHQLIEDYEIPSQSVHFVDVLSLFEADVIMLFTDLLSPDELRDLKDYTFFSFDDVKNLGRGSLSEGICVRHPQFAPYVIAKNVYGEFAAQPILTVKVDAVLVCRANLEDDFVYQVIDQLNEHKQEIAAINPLLYRFSGDFDPKDLSFELHKGARRFLARMEPGLLEKNADLIGVIISILFAIASATYSIARWRQERKNEIGIYYNELVKLRKQIVSAVDLQQISLIDLKLKTIQHETIHSSTTKKMMINEWYPFLNFFEVVSSEISNKEVELARAANKAN